MIAIGDINLQESSFQQAAVCKASLKVIGEPQPTLQAQPRHLTSVVLSRLVSELQVGVQWLSRPAAASALGPGAQSIFISS